MIRVENFGIEKMSSEPATVWLLEANGNGGRVGGRPGKAGKAKQRERGGERRKLFSWRSTWEVICVILLQAQSKIVLCFLL